MSAATLGDFASTADAVAATSSKRRKVELVAGYLSGLEGGDLENATRYFAGRIFPTGDLRTLSVGGAALSTALGELGGGSDLGALWRRHGDPGDVTFEVLAQQERSAAARPITLADLAGAFAGLAAAAGSRRRTELLTALLRERTPEEGRYIVKLIAAEMRIGLREGLVEEAIGAAFERDPAAVTRCSMLVADHGVVARLARAGELESAQPQWFVPMRFMLATPLADADEAVRRLGDEVWVEDKYDGIRCQLHRHQGRVALYSRDLNDVSAQFPEVVDAAAHLEHDLLLDGELLALRGDHVLGFQALQTRLGRKRPAAQVLSDVPVVFVAWDLLRDGGETLLDLPLRDRRTRLEALHLGDGFRLAHHERAVGAAAVDELFLAARARRNEGLMLKDPESPYTPGRRGMSWLKLKRPLDTLDVVVIGAEWGHGKRRGVLSDVTFAVRVDGGDDLVPIGKAYTGLTDAEIAAMTAQLLEITTVEHGHFREVRPEIVLEVAFDNVQRSNRHRSGYALRFPRIARWRTDKPVAEINTLHDVARLAEATEAHFEQRVDRA